MLYKLSGWVILYKLTGGLCSINLPVGYQCAGKHTGRPGRSEAEL